MYMTISVAHQFSDIRGALGAHWGLEMEVDWTFVFYPLGQFYLEVLEAG